MNATRGAMSSQGSRRPRRAGRLLPTLTTVATSARGLQLRGLVGDVRHRLLHAFLPGGRLVDVRVDGVAELRVPGRRALRERRLRVLTQQRLQLGRLRYLARFGEQVKAGQAHRQREPADHVGRAVQAGPHGLVLRLSRPDRRIGSGNPPITSAGPFRPDHMAWFCAEVNHLMNSAAEAGSLAVFGMPIPSGLATFGPAPCAPGVGTYCTWLTTLDELGTS